MSRLGFTSLLPKRIMTFWTFVHLHCPASLALVTVPSHFEKDYVSKWENYRVMDRGYEKRSRAE
jgi:hypothetical protein